MHRVVDISFLVQIEVAVRGGEMHYTEVFGAEHSWKQGSVAVREPKFGCVVSFVGKL